MKDLTGIAIGILIAAAAYLLLRRPSVAVRERELRQPSTAETITDLVDAATDLVGAFQGQRTRREAGGDDADAEAFGNELEGILW